MILRTALNLPASFSRSRQHFNITSSTVTTKSDLLPPFLWRSHQLADRIEDHPELRVVLRFQLVEAFLEVGMGSQDPTQAHEGPHDLDVHQDGSPAAKHGGEHAYSLLGES